MAIIENYTFNKVTRQITFTDLDAPKIERLAQVYDMTADVVIYQGNVTGKKGSFASNVLTLDFDTSALDNNDKLQIFYNLPQDVVRVEDLSAVIEYLLGSLSNPMWVDKLTSAMRVQIQTGANNIGFVGIQANQTVQTVTTVSSLTNIAQIGGRPADSLVLDIQRLNYAQNILPTFN